jgi:hypothetical protein
MFLVIILTLLIFGTGYDLYVEQPLCEHLSRKAHRRQKSLEFEGFSYEQINQFTIDDYMDRPRCNLFDIYLFKPIAFSRFCHNIDDVFRLQKPQIYHGHKDGGRPNPLLARSPIPFDVMDYIWAHILLRKFTDP